MELSHKEPRVSIPKGDDEALKTSDFHLSPLQVPIACLSTYDLLELIDLQAVKENNKTLNTLKYIHIFEIKHLPSVS